MAEEKQPIVIKKIYEEAAAAHGGSWKVALADFMTAMMAFFLVMWLVSSSSEVKKQVASYFSGPSMLEHTYTSYGAELTLEKLFLDLVNEPIGALQKWLQPVDFTPNIMGLGSQKVVLHHVAQELGAVAQNVEIDNDKVLFEIEDRYLFKRGFATPAARYVEVMERVKALTVGLENSVVEVDSIIFRETVKDKNPLRAQMVATQRLDLLRQEIKATFENESNVVLGRAKTVSLTQVTPGHAPVGTIRFLIRQKKTDEGEVKHQKLKNDVGTKDKQGGVYKDFVKRVSK